MCPAGRSDHGHRLRRTRTAADTYTLLTEAAARLHTTELESATVKASRAP